MEHSFHNLKTFLYLAIRLLGAFFMFAFSACERIEFSPDHLVYPTSKAVAASPVVMDFNRDGKLEIAAGSLNGKFYLLDDSLRLLSTWPPRHEKSAHNAGGFYSSAAAWDVDRDTHSELFVGSVNGMLFGWQIQAHTNTPSSSRIFPSSSVA
jgi:hypothetical protein